MLLLSALAFSFEWFFIRKLSNQGFTALDITFGRAFFSMIIIAIFFPLIIKNFFRFSNISKKELGYIVVIGLVTVCSAVLFNSAIKITTVANTLIIFYSCLFWGLLFGFLFLGEKSTKRKILYTFLAFIGIGLALLKDNKTLALTIGIGELFALLASMFFSLDAIISRKVKNTNTFQRMFLIYFVMSSITFLIIMITKGFTYFNGFFSYDFLLYAFALAFTCGFAGKGLMYLGINLVPVSIALVIMLIEPITQMSTAYMLADEKLSIINIVGVFVVFLMVFLISKKEKGLVEAEELK